MTIYDMPLNELETLLNGPEYKSNIYPIHTHPNFERLNDYGSIRTLFDDLTEELGRIPSQTEYVAAGTLRAQKFFTPTVPGTTEVTKRWGKKNMYSGTFDWNDPELQKAVNKRLSRTYPSFLVEYTTIVQLKTLYPGYHIGTNDWLDTTAGIDIAVASPEHNRIVYIHVTSSSQQATDTYNNKKSRVGIAFDKNHKAHWYERNFNKGHIHLVFDKFTDTATTRFVNGNPILKPEHIKHVIDTAMGVPDTTLSHFDTWYPDKNNQRAQQLLHLHNFLLQNKVDEKGLGTVWV